MQRKFLSLLAAAVALTFCTCTKPPCWCDFDESWSIECKFVNAQGQDLVFGSASQYKPDSIRVLKNRNDFYANNAAVRKGIFDTMALRFDFYIVEDKSYVYFNQQAKDDSLEINWDTKTGRCCGGPQTYMAISRVQFNGKVVQPQKGTYVFVKQ